MPKNSTWLVAALTSIIIGLATVVWSMSISRVTTVEQKMSQLIDIVHDDRNRLVVIETRYPDMKATLERMEAKLAVLESLIKTRNISDSGYNR